MTQSLFELWVGGNGLLLKGRVLLGKSYCDGLGSDLASPAPGIGWLMHEAALADPVQSKQLFFELFVASSDPPHCGGRQNRFCHAIILDLIFKYMYALAIHFTTPFFGSFRSTSLGR